MNSEKLQNSLNQFWDNEITPSLIEYIKVPNKSPAFDPDWEEAGHMDNVLEPSRRLGRINIDLKKAPFMLRNFQAEPL